MEQKNLDLLIKSLDFKKPDNYNNIKIHKEYDTIPNRSILKFNIDNPKYKPKYSLKNLKVLNPNSWKDEWKTIVSKKDGRIWIQGKIYVVDKENQKICLKYLLPDLNNKNSEENDIDLNQELINYFQNIPHKSYVDIIGEINTRDENTKKFDNQYDNNINADIVVDVKNCYELLKFKEYKQNQNETIKVDETNKNRFEWLVNSNLDLMNGIEDDTKIVDTAIQKGLNGIAILNRDNVQNFPVIQNHLKKINNQDFKVVYGTSLSVRKNDDADKVIDLKNDKLNTYVVFDIETTSLDKKTGEIIEIAALKIQDGKVIDKFETFIKPNSTISQFTTELTNITNDMVKNAPKFEEIGNKFVDFCKDSVLVGHNIFNFDIPYVNEHLKEHNLKTLDTNNKIDTMNLSRMFFNDKARHNLQKFCEYNNTEYDTKTAHRAIYDVEVNYNAFANFLKENNIQTLKKLEEISKTKRDIKFLKKVKSDNSIVNVYAKNQKGIKTINQLISISNTEQIINSPTIKQETLWNKIKENKENLLVSNGVDLFDNVLENALYFDKQSLVEELKKYDFITLAPIDSVLSSSLKDFLDLETIQKAYLFLVDTLIENKIKTVIVSNASYLENNNTNKQALGILINSINNKKSNSGYYHPLLKHFEEKLKSYREENNIDSKDKPLYLSPNKHLRDGSELINDFKWMFEVNPKYKKFIEYATYDVPTLFAKSVDKNITPMVEGLNPPEIDNVENLLAFEVWNNVNKTYGKKDLKPIENIEKLTTKQIADYYKKHIPQNIVERIEYELNSIFTHKFSVVYWVSHLLVKKSNEDGYMVGSRGSVGSSIVATFLNVTDINPLKPHYICRDCNISDFNVDSNVSCGFDLPNRTCKQCNQLMDKSGHDIPFETFLGFKGDKIPDIDLNFADVYQKIAHNFIREYFGADKCLRAGTIGTIAEKTADIEFGNYDNKEKDILLKENENNNDVLSPNNYLTTNEDVIEKLVGVKRTTGQHAGGIIVIPNNKELEDFTPVSYPADDLEANWKTTHHAFEYLHDTLLKFDILGHLDPAMLYELKHLTKIDPQKDINFKDKNEVDKVLSWFARSKAFGLPEFGTNFARVAIDEMGKEKNLDKFENIVKASGLLHGTNVWSGNVQDVLKENPNLTLNDVPCCRDDIMVELINKYNMDKKLSFDIMELIRKGKWNPDKNEEHKKQLDEMVKHNVPKHYIDVCKKIAYMFPKAHASAYCYNAYRIAWFKEFYPKEFYCAWLSTKSNEIENTVIKSISENQEFIESLKTADMSKKQKTDFKETHDIIDEALTRGIKFGGLNLKYSNNEKFIIKDGVIYSPLKSIKGLDKPSKAFFLALQEMNQDNSIDIEKMSLSEFIDKVYSITENIANKGEIDKPLKLSLAHIKALNNAKLFPQSMLKEVEDRINGIKPEKEKKVKQAKTKKTEEKQEEKEKSNESLVNFFNI